MENIIESHEKVREYYGKILQSQKDLKTNACCTTNGLPSFLRDILRTINPEIIEKFYGCGSPIPEAIEGKTVLDLGCGTGRDVYLLSKLVGENGKVIGVDMNDAQLEVAEKHLESQMKTFGYTKPNVVFHKGYIEDLREIGIVDHSVDVIVSNCVVNLSPNKPAVFREIFRVLKPGGELFFSDIFSAQRIPASLQKDQVLLGECLSGALYVEDFRRLLQGLGCLDYRIVSSNPVTINNDEVKAKIGNIDFCSLTLRAFKLATLEDRCEDYGQMAVYRGSIPESPHRFVLDDHHIFIKGKPMAVCGNTASMLAETRYQNHFQVTGDRSVHYGIFDCAPAAGFSGKTHDEPGACC